MRCLCLATAPLALALVALAAPAAAGRVPWTASDPDALVAVLARGAERGGDEALARLFLISALAEDTRRGLVVDTLRRVKGPAREEAEWLARTMVPPPLGAHDRHEAEPDSGLVRNYAVIGPFENSGGGLERREGPETAGHEFASADFSWGAYQVRWQSALESTAAGVPLDRYVSPRQESCSYLASALELDRDRVVVAHVATSGSFRFAFDGVDVAGSSESHANLTADRAAVRLSVQRGWHVATLKVCSSAIADEGRVRLRLSDGAGGAVAVRSSSDLATLQAATGARAATSFERIPTVLERALDAGEAPSAERALAAGVVRALGADDVASPRAPGLLDRAVQTAPAEHAHEILAIAGAISSFPANRSGWLGEAVTRARARGDAATAIMAQSGLVLFRLDQGQADLAQATLDSEPLSLQAGAHARWLRAKLRMALGGEGLMLSAREELDSIARDHGDKTPLAVWRNIAQLSYGRDASRRLEAQMILAGELADERGMALLGAMSMNGAEAIERSARVLAAQASSADEVEAIGRRLLELGRYQAAREILSAASRHSPNHSGLLDALTHVELAARPAAAPEASEEIEQAYGRFRELVPDDAARASELAFRRGELSEAGTADPGEDAPYLVDPQVFLARARAKAAGDDVTGRILHWRRVVRFHPDKRVSQMAHYAREVVVPPRTDAERYERTPSLGYGSQELVLARVHRKDGTIAQPEQQNVEGAWVMWPELQRGDVVEVALRSWTVGPVGRRGDPPFYFVDTVGGVETEPVLYNEVVLDAPAGSPFAHDVIGGKPDDERVETRAGRTITWLTWNAPPIAPHEPLAPPPSETLPMVVGSIYAGWGSFLSWYRGAVEGFDLPDEQVKRLARELTEGKSTREEKVEALFNYVADDIRYLNYVSGEWWLPNRPQELLARRQGDCDDKAMLLISLLGAVGIEAQEVLVQTRYTGQPTVLQSSRAAVPLFDHGIIFLPDAPSSGTREAPGGGRFLDATSPQSRIGALPSMDAGAAALLVRGDRVVTIPPARAEDHGIDATWRLELDASGGGTLRAKERHVGDSAFYLRTYLAQADARAQWVEQNVVRRWLSAVELEPTITFNSSLPQGAAELEFRARSSLVARREGTELLVMLAPSESLTANLAPLTRRTLPVVLPPQLAPRHETLTAEIVAPAGYAFAELPPEATLDGGSFGSAKLGFALSRDKRTVTMTRTIALAVARIDVGQYPAWRAWLQGIDRLVRRGVRLVPSGPAPR